MVRLTRRRARAHLADPRSAASHWPNRRWRHSHLRHPLPRFDLVRGNSRLQRRRYDPGDSHRHRQWLRRPVQPVSWRIVVHQVRSSLPSRTFSSNGFRRITLDVILSNPAPLILHTNLVSLEIVYRGTGVGRAYIDPLDLYLGTSFSFSLCSRNSRSRDLQDQTRSRQSSTTSRRIPATRSLKTFSRSTCRRQDRWVPFASEPNEP